MAYPFVQAHYDYGPRKGPVKAFVVHMAEGGGTVHFLSKANKHGVSVHYVVERGGRVVQMLKESRASGSIRPSAIRTTDDKHGVFGASAAKAVMGSWWRDPNSAVISVEVEGFAKDGPDPEQVAALADLVADVRSRFPNLRVLGHRDFQNYKRCPGRQVPWDRLGGHGKAGHAVAQDAVGGAAAQDAAAGGAAADAAAGEIPINHEEEAVKAFPVPENPSFAQVKLDAWLHQFSDMRADPGNVQLTDRTPEQLRLRYVGTFSKEVRIVAYERVGPPDPNGSSLAMFIDASDITGMVPGPG